MESRYKFRAKSLDTGKWIYGGYYEVEGNAVILHQTRGNQMQHSAVDCSTVGQWTGRTDKSGTEVYEKQILEEDGQWYTVVWSDDDCSWWASGIEDTESIALSEIVSHSWLQEKYPL